MNDGGKKRALSCVDRLQPQGTTNLWDGLSKAMNVMTEAGVGAGSSMGHILLLTDGIPNIIPPRGHIPMLKRYKKGVSLPFNIGTMGFGYELDSQLLVDIAREGEGESTG